MREPLLAATPTATDKLVGDDAEMTRFLDQLMLAESGGRDDARNPRSTAVGPFQFIESTFLEICRRHFAAETATLGPAQILALRKNRAFARRAAEAFTRDNAGILTANDLSPSMSNLRLAFLLGAGAAVRVLKSEPGAPLINLLGAQVVQANPFMAGMSSRDLTLWSGRNLAMQKPDQLLFANSGAKSPPAGHPAPVPGATPGSSITGATVPSMQAVAPKKVIAVTCNLDLASCRKHLALAERRLAAELSRKVVAAQSAKRSRTR